MILILHNYFHDILETMAKIEMYTRLVHMYINQGYISTPYQGCNGSLQTHQVWFHKRFQFGFGHAKHAQSKAYKTRTMSTTKIY